MRTLRKICAIVGVITLASGCVTKTVVIDKNSDIVRLDKPVKARVSIYKGNGVWESAGTMKLPAGWVCGPGPSD